jgi:hypothetical protein
LSLKINTPFLDVYGMHHRPDESWPSRIHIHTAMLSNWFTSVQPVPDKKPQNQSAKKLWSDHGGFVVTRCGSGSEPDYVLRFWDDVIARISTHQKTVHITPLSPKITSATIHHLLYDQIYPRVIAHEGRLVLHAGAVEISDQLAVFLGDSGLGKSTLVASLYQTGSPLLNDDTLVVSGEAGSFSGQAIYRGLRLLPDSLASLFPQQTETHPMAHYSPKQRLDVAVATKEDSLPKPLGALFFLAPTADLQEIALRPMTAAETCMGLIANSFSLDPTDTRQARNKLLQASALANGVAAFELSYPRDYSALPQVHALIRSQMSECRPQTAATIKEAENS